MEGIGFLSGHAASEARGASADGSTVVGYSCDDQFIGCEGFIWREPSGMQALGILPGFTSSNAEDVSADGMVIVGQSWSDDDYEAYTWNAISGIVPLGTLPGALGSWA